MQIRTQNMSIVEPEEAVRIRDCVERGRIPVVHISIVGSNPPNDNEVITELPADVHDEHEGKTLFAVGMMELMLGYMDCPITLLTHPTLAGT
jgi:hypothetical protein